MELQSMNRPHLLSIYPSLSYWILETAQGLKGSLAKYVSWNLYNTLISHVAQTWRAFLTNLEI